MAWLLRMLGSLVILRVIGRRLARARTNNPDGALMQRRMRVLLRNVRSDTAILMHAGVAVASGAAVLLGAVIGITLFVLGPRWLAVVDTVITVIFLAICLLEIRHSWRGLQMRYWRTRHVVISSDEETTEVR